MAAWTTGLLTSIFNRINGSGEASLLVLEKADNTGVIAQAGAANGLAIEGAAGGTPVPISGTVTATVTGVATEVTAAAILAKLIAAPATAALQTAANALLGATRSTTAPNVTTATQRLIEVARDGSVRVNADIYNFAHQMHLVATGAAAQAAFVRTAPTYPFDGLWVGTDDVVVYGQPRGSAYPVPDGLTFAAPASWTTAGTDWSIAASKATHAASGGGTDELVPVAMGGALEVGKTYVVYTKVVHRGGTSVTAYCGTAAGTAITATGEHVQALVCTGSSAAKLVATDDWDGDVLAYQIYEHTPKLAAKSYMPFSLTEIVGVAASSALTTLIVATGCDVHGLYRRTPGEADLG